MGGSSSKKEEVRVEYRDITQSKVDEAKSEISEQFNRRLARLKEEQRLEENKKRKATAQPRIQIVDKDITDVKKTEAEDEAKERVRNRFLEEDRKQQQAESKRDQTRRKAFKEIDSKRELLKDYRFGSINGMRSFGNMDVKDMCKEGGLRLGLFGPAGSGKSSFISTCERTMREAQRGTADVKAEGGEGTIRICDYLAGDWDFLLVDSRGFGEYGKHELAAFADIMFGNITIGQIVKFEPNDTPRADADHGDIKNWIHSVIFVVSGIDPRLTSGRLNHYLNPMRDFLKPRGVAGITLITHKDKIEPEDYETTLHLASAATGSAKNHTFFVKNYTGETDRDHETEKSVCEILRYALMMGERYVKIAKHQLMQKAAMRAEGGADDSPGQTIEDFLEKLQKSKSLPKDKVKLIQDNLEDGGIRTTFALHTAWDEVKKRVRLSKLLTKYIQESLDVIFPN
ncbi:uncharacterized protein LOC144439227 [Glandiceps talaboti]